MVAKRGTFVKSLSVYYEKGFVASMSHLSGEMLRGLCDSSIFDTARKKKASQSQHKMSMCIFW